MFAFFKIFCNMASMIKPLFSLLALMGTASTTSAAVIKTETLLYRQGDTVLEGFLAYPEGGSKKPAVLIVHDWMGPSEFTQEKAKKMAALGYVALAADIYGQGNRAKNPEEAKKLAAIRQDTDLFRKRVQAGLEALTSRKDVIQNKVVAFGFCFGGSAVLELARSGADVAGVVSFHGGIKPTHPQDAKNIKGKVLVLHGAIDPNVPDTDVAAFEKEMNDAHVDWQLVKYSGAVHAFTNPKAGNDISKGAAYNADADRRSWRAFLDFLTEVAPSSGLSR